MKRLRTFILESFENNFKTYIVTDLKVVYDCGDISIEVPENYSESDMQIYLDDVLLNKMPGVSKKSIEMLKSDSNEISDAYFEYDSFNVSEERPSRVDIIFDNKDGNTNYESLVYYALKDVKFVVSYSTFTVKADNYDSVKDAIKIIFKTLGSSAEYLIPIKLNTEVLSISFADSIEEKDDE